MELSKIFKLGLWIWLVALAVIATSAVLALGWLAFLGGFLAGIAGFCLGIDVERGGGNE